MPKIITLDDKIIPKIAAGEVVERPASVVKELVENSLDAGAKNIEIQVEQGGLKRIRVVDDGEGMDQKDLLKCYLPHTTSKLTDVESLSRINTLGFRGEALSSISAVSTVVIKSKEEDASSGNYIKIINGNLERINPVGMSKGTIVEVSNIFSDVPARKKFLKKPQTEYRHILNTVTAFVLANNSVGFKLSHNGKVILDIKSHQDLQSRIKILLGEDVFNNVFKFENSKEHIVLKGYLSKPQISTYNSDLQFVFVNKRAVQDKNISSEIKKAYGNMVDQRSFPPFILDIQLPADLVDVNIHPRKQEVRFWDFQKLNSLIFETVKKELDKHDLMYAKGYCDISGQRDIADSFEFLLLKDDSPKWIPKNIPQDEIIQINKKYLAYPYKDGIMLIDQHAAHESILYEEYHASFVEKRANKNEYVLQMPVVLTFSLTESDYLNENILALTELGFEIHSFGTNSFKLEAVPEIFKDHNYSLLIKELLEDLQNSPGDLSVDEKSKKSIEYLSCRGAIKAGEELSIEERVNLVKKIEELKGLYTCPHGRPIKFYISEKELDKMFKRST